MASVAKRFCPFFSGRSISPPEKYNFVYPWLISIVLRSKFPRSVSPCNFKKVRSLADHHRHPRLIPHSLAPQRWSPLVGPSHCHDETMQPGIPALHSAFIRSVVVKTDKSLALVAHQIVALTPRWSSTCRTGYRTTARTRPSRACGQDQCHNHECSNPTIHF